MDISQIMQTDAQCYMNTFGKRTPIAFTHGKGACLFDTQGKKYTDFLAGIAVNCLGYGDKGLADAISRQASELLHCSNIFYIEQQALLAQKLFDLSGGYKAFFCNSGAEANEGAFKLARKYFYKRGENRYEIISAKNSFHGRTLATVAATGQEKYQKPYSPLPEGFINVEFNSREAILGAVTDRTAAIIVETIQGEGGVLPCSAEYLQFLRELCDQEGILLIIDEVQTGIFRTGCAFSFEKYGIKPDIFTLAKGLGGGVPIGAVMALPDVADAFEPGDHGTTFGGNPLACAAANYVLSTLTSDGFIKRIEHASVLLLSLLGGLKEKYAVIKDVRGAGLLIGVELAPAINGKAFVSSALEKGFIINCAGHNTIRLAPPFVITDQDIYGLAGCMDEILSGLTA